MDVLVCTSIKAYYLASDDIPKSIPQFFVGEDVKERSFQPAWSSSACSGGVASIVWRTEHFLLFTPKPEIRANSSKVWVNWRMPASEL